jgi:hypothetical protein
MAIQLKEIFELPWLPSEDEPDKPNQRFRLITETRVGGVSHHKNPHAHRSQ